MTFSFLWFGVGVAIGVTVGLACVWLLLRRAHRKPAKTAQEEMDRFAAAMRDVEIAVGAAFAPIMQRMNDSVVSISKRMR